MIEGKKRKFGNRLKSFYSAKGGEPLPLGFRFLDHGGMVELKLGLGAHPWGQF